MIARWLGGTNDSSTKRLMFQVLFFFRNFLQNSLQKLFQFIFLFFYNFTKTLYFHFCKFIKKKFKGFLQRTLQDFINKNNTWNIRRLVDESFVPSTHDQGIIMKIVGFLRGSLCNIRSRPQYIDQTF